MIQTQTAPEIITAPAERRQIARVLHFPLMDGQRGRFSTADYINWESIAQTSRELGANFIVRYAKDGACTVTMFWTYTEEEIG